MGRKKKDQGPTPPPAEHDAGGKRRGRPIPLWQKMLLGVSVVLMLGGGAAWGYSTFVAKERPARVAGTPGDSANGGASGGGTTGLPGGLVSDFGPGGTGTGSGTGGATGGAVHGTDGSGTPSGSEIQTALDTWSPAVFRLGFSFFAAFAMAYALRQFLKVTLVVVGAALVGMFALQYLKVITVDWSLVEGKFDSVAAFIRSQTETFTKFVSGYLPSATSAAAGAFVGFRKK